MEQYLVGIDIGTSGCKACLFDTEGAILGECYIEYPCYYPHPGWVEQKAEDVIPACFDAIKSAVEQSGVDRELIAAMAVSTQGATISMMDANGDLVRDFVVWQDIRAAGTYPAKLREYISDSEYYQRMGKPMDVPTTAYAKWMWLYENERENWDRTEHFGSHIDYFTHFFGGEGYYTDLSSASRESMLDIDKGEWDPFMHEKLHIPLEKRSVIVKEPGKVVGQINEYIASMTGLPAGCKVCMGAHDQNCNTFGCGLLHGGDAVIVAGSFGSCFIASDKSVRDPNEHLVVKPNHGMGNYTAEAYANAAASSFKWYVNTMCDMQRAEAEKEGISPYQFVDQDIEGTQPGSGGVIFLPHLSGSGARLNHKARGTYLNMSLATTQNDISRATMEGICYEIRDIVQLEENAGITVQSYKMTGGAAKSDVWCQIMCDILGKPLSTLVCDESGCLGAAMYAGVGVGIYKDVNEAAERAVKVKKTYMPDLSKRELYEEGYRKWITAYKALAKSFYC